MFVTGGGGYVASHCIVELLKENFNVIAVDNYVNSIRGKLYLYIESKLVCHPLNLSSADQNETGINYTACLSLLYLNRVSKCDFCST